MSVKTKGQQKDGSMELDTSTKHQAFEIIFMRYLSMILNYENVNVLVPSGRLFYCKINYFWLTKLSFQSAIRSVFY